MLFSVIACAGAMPGASPDPWVGPAIAAIAAVAWAVVLAWASVSDMRRRIIPNAAVAAGIVVWLAALCASEVAGIDVRTAAAEGLAGALLLGAGMLVFCVVFERAAGRASMGGGDIKLFAMVALYLGVMGALASVMLACILAIVVSFARHAPDEPFAFGPFISTSAAALAICSVVRAFL